MEHTVFVYSHGDGRYYIRCADESGSTRETPTVTLSRLEQFVREGGVYGLETDPPSSRNNLSVIPAIRALSPTNLGPIQVVCNRADCLRALNALSA